VVSEFAKLHFDFRPKIRIPRGVSRSYKVWSKYSGPKVLKSNYGNYIYIIKVAGLLSGETVLKF
jgi:hypothetical protein